jgi:hypothetical protein
MNKKVVMTSALALAVAALAVPTAQANLTPAGKYGPLDPWAYKLIHQSGQSVPLITEHSAGQNTTGQAGAAGKYGPLDPGIAAAIRNHSRGLNGVSKSAAASVPAAAPNGFDWGDAGIGATVAFAALLLALAVATLILRRRGNRLAGL